LSNIFWQAATLGEKQLLEGFASVSCLLFSVYTHHLHLTASQGVSSNYSPEAWGVDINLISRSTVPEEQKIEAWQLLQDCP